MRYKKTASIDTTSLVSLIIVDSDLVGKTIKRYLPKDKKWVIINSAFCVSLINKESGIDSEFKPKCVVKIPLLDKYASSSKEVFIATVPDNRGDYNAFKISEYIRLTLRLSIPVYRMFLPSITDYFVSYSILNPKNVYLSVGKRYRYESRMALDSLVKYNVNSLFKELPIEPNLELYSASILDFIDTIQNSKGVKAIVNNISLSTHLIKKEKTPKKVYAKILHKEYVGRVPSFRDFFISSSGFISWFGLVKSMYESYSSGNITWPTSDTSRKVPNQLKNDIEGKTSKSSNGLIRIKNSNNDININIKKSTDYIASQIEYLNGSCLDYIQVALRIKKKCSSINHILLPKDEYFSSTPVENFKIERLGASQKDVLSFLLSIDMPVSLITWNIYTLVKNGLIVYTEDTYFQITSLGKYVLNIIRLNVPTLLKRKFLSSINKGIKNQIKSKDDMEYYEFMDSIWKKIKDEIDSIETVQLPSFISRCAICNKVLRLSVTEKGVFASCSNNKCSTNGINLPLKIKKDKIVVIRK